MGVVSVGVVSVGVVSVGVVSVGVVSVVVELLVVDDVSGSFSIALTTLLRFMSYETDPAVSNAEKSTVISISL